MKLHNKAWYMAIGGILALVLVFGAVATFAQSDEGEAEPPAGDVDEGTFPGIPWGRHGHKRFDGATPVGAADKEALAEALGISVEELEEALAAVRQAKLADLVESGVLTQEQVDLMMARQAIQSYIDREALAEMLRDAYESAIDQAVADGAISQAQADLLLEQEPGFRLNRAPSGFGGHHGRRGFGGFRGGSG